MSKSKKKKERIYRVAKEFHLSNEELIDFLKSHNFRVRNQMSQVTDEMYELIKSHFAQEKTEQAPKESDFKRKIEEKKIEEEARKQAIRQEIDDVIQRSKADIDIEEKKEKEKGRKKEEKREKELEPSLTETEEDVKAGKKKGSRKVEQEKQKPLTKKKVETKEEEKKEEVQKPKRHLKRRPVKKKKKPEFKKEVEVTAKKSGKKEPEKSISEKEKKKKVKGRKKKKTPRRDKKEIEASIKKTFAKMSDTPKKRKYKKKKKTEQEEEASERKVIKTTEFATVSELANLIDVDPGEIIAVCMSLGIMVTINQRLDRDTILMVADEFDYDVEFETEYGEDKVELLEEEEEEDTELLEERPPVVTIMGHVDHGKTSLLDYIRKSSVITDESGGITQHIGAYEITHKKKKIVFLDTPGHEAFTAMRARGAKVTDIVVLIVAADDGVMPQTVEAINHARAAGDSGVPIIVAINKIDRPDANPNEVRKQLSEHNILVEEWGGKIQDAEISAKTGDGVNQLLEKILLEAEMLELKANPKTKPRGVIIEAKMIKGKGVVSTILVNKGTLKVGDIFVAGQFNGRVRALYNENNKKVKKAGPSKPVQVLGFTGVPQAGDSFVVVDSEQEAKRICNKRQQLRREQSFRQVKRTTLDQISKEISEGKIKELSLLIKGDVDGSVEAIADSLMALSTDEVGVKIVHKGVGTIVESDVLLAETSNAVIIGFQVDINVKAREVAREENVDIRRYDVIYDIVNDVKLALSGLLEPERNEEIIGSAEIRKIYKSSKTGLIAGCYMIDGKAQRGSLVRLIRDQDVVYEGKVDSLKRFQNDVKEVDSGYECGIVLDNCDDIQEGDTMEFYKIVEKARTL